MNCSSATRPCYQLVYEVIYIDVQWMQRAPFRHGWVCWWVGSTCEMRIANRSVLINRIISPQKNKSFQRHQVLILMCRLVDVPLRSVCMSVLCLESVWWHCRNRWGREQLPPTPYYYYSHSSTYYDKTILYILILRSLSL